jgi:hypothetical protein
VDVAVSAGAVRAGPTRPPGEVRGLDTDAHPFIIDPAPRRTFASVPVGRRISGEDVSPTKVQRPSAGAGERVGNRSKASRTPTAVGAARRASGCPYDPEGMSDDIASEVIAKYAVVGPRVELERTLPLEPSEILIVGVIAHTTFGDWPFPFDRHRRGFLRLSTQRLCIVRHYGFIRDRIVVIPPRAITGVKARGPGESVHITFRMEHGDRVITIATWREPTVPIDHNVLDSRDLDEQLRHVARALDPTASNRG